MRGQFVGQIVRWVRTLPSWVLIVAGQSLLAGMLLTPAWLDCRQLRWQGQILQRQAEVLLAQEQRGNRYLQALESDDPVLIRRLAYDHLRLAPTDHWLVNLDDPPAAPPPDTQHPALSQLSLTDTTEPGYSVNGLFIESYDGASLPAGAPARPDGAWSVVVPLREARSWLVTCVSNPTTTTATSLVALVFIIGGFVLSGQPGQTVACTDSDEPAEA